ncbi:helicase HelZ [Actinoplanes philippinensis]|uniref:Superfamily II DNA or RNA helicase, SNF2 family n=1 Tax=Actinoplanes philippinensis TaxID=35752 RepID=A0A1I2CMF0_9ACTN|nr:DEAD/DEAH box helicase [Actinoplanes philippinensis]GIE74826.1 helicase HelZ [Actinoplanes philippinensis]SFE68920.1 Superfamily II DNA or RNA helicase, SNF2 family [Actinoplanes philippinensis]
MTAIVRADAAGVRVLHGLVGRDGGLSLWAEDGAAAGSAAGRGAAPPHPFAVAVGGLPAGDPRAEATVLLPSTGAGPLPSPHLGLPPRRGTPRGRAWRVPAVSVPFVDVDLVAEFEGRVAPSAGWLVELCGFAAGLVRRGRVLPGVRIDGPRPVALWRPVVTGADAVRCAALRDRMPPACRAEQPATGVEATAGELMEAALARLVDGLVRTRLAEARVTLADYGWLAALTGEPEFDAAPALADTLAGRLDAWFEQAAGGAEVRVCFRLSDPREHEPVMPDEVPLPEDTWRLEFLLQAVDEPSVLVPAADVWRDRSAPLRRWTSHPQERLLAGLGRAARLHPELAEALRDTHPAQMLLDTEGAHRFLSHAALLEESGYGVLLPAWWRRRPGLGLSLEVRGRDPVSHVLRDRAVGLRELVDYRWGLALGGRTLTEDDLTDLARAKVPLVRLRGRWVFLDPERLAAGLAFLRRGGGRMTAGDALRMMRLLPPEDVPLPVTDARGEGWLADLLGGRLDQRLEVLPPPAGFEGVLRPYQIRGFSWLAFLDSLGLGACLADDMGLGKTVQLLALLLHHREGPALLVCPLSVLGNWQREAERFAPALRVRVLHGADRADPAVLAAGADVVLTTYATAVRDADALAAISWDRVVLDEAQHIKNSGGATAKAVRRFPARNRIALTGTPVENRLAELWSILDFVNPGILASAHTFRARFAVPIERYAEEDAAARLRQATRPFLLRRTKADHGIAADLPTKRHVRHLCGMTVEQVSLYRAVLDDLLERLAEPGEKWRKGLVLAAMTKLKQACVHPALLLKDASPLPGRSGKIDRLEEIVDHALGAGESVLCFTQFARFGGMLTPHLAARFGVPVRFLHGGTPRGARDSMVADFQRAERPGVFVLSLKAGGTGLNLTAANHVVHIDRWWNPATETQASDRAFRIGQRRDVHIHTLVCLGTLEERIDRVLTDKGVLADRVVGSGEGWLSALSAGEIRDLFALAPEAIVD